MNSALLGVLACLMCAVPVPAAAWETLTGTASRQMPGVEWVDQSAVVGDFDGDGVDDHALLGHLPARVVLAVRIGPTTADRPVQFLEFGVNPGAQDAICALPARLYVHELSCDPLNDGDPLPGCKPSSVAKALTLSGGDCDAIHLYWSHTEHSLQWWRH